MTARPPRPDAEGRVVAVAACRAPGSTDLLDDPDWPVLRDALATHGVRAQHVAWDDDTVDWSRFGAVVIRSTWDATDRPDQFVDWADAVARVTTLQNPLTAVEWNLDKRYLATLADDGIPTVPTVWLAPGEEWEPAGGVVVKPTISAGGTDTAWFAADQAEAAGAHVKALTAGGRSVMVQPHVDGIDEMGELKVAFVEGVLTHAIRINGMLREGEGVVDRLFEREHRALELDLRPSWRKTATDAMASAQRLVGEPLLYGRVDLVPGDAPGAPPQVLEVELIEPYLSLCLYPPAATRLAGAIRRAGRA